MEIIAALLVGGVTLFFGGVVCLVLKGFGICGSELTIFKTLVCMAIAMLMSILGVGVVPSKRCLAACMFSLPLGFATLMLAIDHEWLRCLSILGCIITAGATVWLAAKGQTIQKSDKQ
jgi:hypothetical protein